MSKKEMQKSFPEAGLLYALSFVIPVLVMLFVLKVRGFYPFGEKSMFIMDMRDQYLEFFASLRGVLSGDDSLFFSWSRSMGGNYLGLFAYYVASPLSFITVFFPLKDMTLAIVVLTVLKIGLSGLSFAFFGNYLCKNKKILVLPFAVSYALISYNIVYGMCLMWLDGVIMLPVILLGVEKILDGRRGLHYMLALAALFVCNYYTGYMVGIFTALYVIFRIICRIGKDNVKEYVMKALRFAGCTLMAFGLSAPLILPVVKDLMQGKLSAVSYVPDIQTNFAFSGLFGKLKNGVYDSITNAGLPAIYCGYAIVLLAVIFFFLPRISVREKAGAAIILILMSLSFYFTKLDIMWHGFQYPTWFPFRYAFVFSFFLLYMALRAIYEIFCMDNKRLRAGSTAVIAAAALCIVAVVDLGVNAKSLSEGLENEFGYAAAADYEAFLDKTQPLVEEIKEKDGGFYRMNQGFEYSKNDAMLLGYNGMTHYSSTFNASVNALTPKLGIAQSHIWNSGYGSNAMLDSLFAVKYIMEDGIVPSDYTRIGSNESGACSYENPYALPIAYAAPCVNVSPDINYGDPFTNQNTFLNTIAGTDGEYFTAYEYNTLSDGAGWSYTFTADSDNPVYLYMFPDNGSWADVYVNNSWVGNYFSTETTCSLYLGSFQPGEEVVVNVVPSGEASVRYAVIAGLNMDLLRETLGTLNENGMELTEHSGGRLSGKITVGDGQKIITSIPYDEGWTVKIDGKKAGVEKFADTFLVIDAGSGEHSISFQYISPGFKAGMLLFAAAVLSAVIYFVPLRKWLSGARK
ncbi:MAG: YfhO family protein [Lachnospiraceae bacterium]|nr:YfhO family protein [Lachnospiraceae bacterium]